MTEQENLIQKLKNDLIIIQNYINLCKVTEVENQLIKIISEVESHFEQLIDFLEKNTIPINYINVFKNDNIEVFQHFTYRDPNFIPENPEKKIEVKNRIEESINRIPPILELIEFNFDFFQKINFLQNNTVAIGANGSGKTTLSNELKKYLPKNGVVISAQKILIVPTFSGISNFDQTNESLKSNQTLDKSLRTTFSTKNDGNAYGILRSVGGEFQILLDNLLAERSAIRNKHWNDIEKGNTETKKIQTRLDKALKIWNSLIEHRTIDCTDGINITLKTTDGKEYPAHEMSDGEKTVLYLIAQVIQAPESGFIIVDEPEIYLHKTILSKLWDVLEKERQDCIFIYLTHDLDFAVTRTTATKVWIKSFSHPTKWEIEQIPDNDLPESLLLELLGSRKNILFCEGKKGSKDEKIYNILFPNFTITPVESCFNVINYTKAFNRIPNRSVKAFGLIDSDHHSDERLQKIEEDNIYSISLAEIENLFLDKEFLRNFATKILKTNDDVELIIQAVIEKFKKEFELQISNYISAKINNYFKDSDMSKGNTLEDVKENYHAFSKEIKIDEWYSERQDYLNQISESQNYELIIAVYNNKGLKIIPNQIFKISDFTDRAINLIQFDVESHKPLLDKFPEDLVKNGL